jgi:hypothetical protein
VEEDQALDVGVKLEPLVDGVRVGKRAEPFRSEPEDGLGQLPVVSCVAVKMPISLRRSPAGLAIVRPDRDSRKRKTWN